MIETLGTGGRGSESTSPVQQERGSVIDWTAGLEVAAGDTALLAELIALFSADAPRRMASLWRALEAGAMTSIAHEAHTMKGAAAHIGAYAVHQAAMRLEEAAKHQDERAAGTAYDTLIYELARLQAALSAAATSSAEAPCEGVSPEEDIYDGHD